MAWGCDLDPGNTGAQLSTPAGKLLSRTSHVIVVSAMHLLTLEVLGMPFQRTTTILRTGVQLELFQN